ncbi:MAG TPA: M1 family metallopeptidase [Actinomycetes bacterium]|jgi:aminopeptidase N|nr:M1 family metallopeptidase [Actinomycetes bacterium]
MRVAASRLTAVLAAAGTVSGCWLSSGDRDVARDPTSATLSPDVGTATGTDPAPVAGAAGGGDSYFPSYGNGGYEVTHYRLQLGYDPDSDRLTASATIDARARQALRAFNLDLVGLSIRSITVDGSPARWRRTRHELTVTPAEPLGSGTKFRTVVRYSGRPERGFRTTDDGALAAGQPEAAAFWFPVNDHPTDKATYTFVVTVPSGLVAVANGELASHRGNTWTWTATAPMASYLTTVAIGDFDLRSYRTSSGLRMWDAVDRRIGTIADRSLARQGRIIDFLAGRFGRYPFDTGGAIVDNHPLGFALETQTRPVYESRFFGGGDPGEELILVHEIAHQWFGDSVSVSRWRDIVINEGFATYAEWLWMEEAGYATADQAFDFFYRGLPADNRFWSLRVADPGPDELFNVAVYWRGAMTLHQLREEVGDAAFFDILRRWAAVKAGGNGTLDEFVELAEQVSGQQPDKLFRDWLRTTGKPDASLSSGGEPLTDLGRLILEQRAYGLIDG